MTRERWAQINEKILQQFPDAKFFKETLDDDSGGHKEIVEFFSALGRIKLEFVEKPRFIGEKTQYSKRIGGAVQVTKQYDPDEMVCYMKAFKQADPGQWAEINSSQFI